jgi:hypothetical protein
MIYVHNKLSTYLPLTHISPYLNLFIEMILTAILIECWWYYEPNRGIPLPASCEICNATGSIEAGELGWVKLINELNMGLYSVCNYVCFALYVSEYLKMIIYACTYSTWKDERVTHYILTYSQKKTNNQSLNNFIFKGSSSNNCILRAVKYGMQLDRKYCKQISLVFILS